MALYCAILAHMAEKLNELRGSEIKSDSSPKKRVLFIVTQSEAGGAQQFIAQLLNQLDSTKFEATLVTGRDGRGEMLATTALPTIVAKSLRRKPNVFQDIFSLFELRRIILEQKPDILF